MYPRWGCLVLCVILVGGRSTDGPGGVSVTLLDTGNDNDVESGSSLFVGGDHNTGLAMFAV